MKNLLYAFGFFLFSALAPTQHLNAQQIPTIDFFYGEECTHCHDEIDWFPELKKMYPDLKINKFEIWHNSENLNLVKNQLKKFNQKFSGVPTSIVAGEIIVGFDPEKILEIFEIKYGAPHKDKEAETATKKAIQKESGWKKFLNLSWPAMSFVLGILDGFNPCAMWSLLILIGFLLSIDKKQKRWLIGIVFISSSGILYFGALLTYLFGFSEISQIITGELMLWIFRIVGIFAIITGSLALKNCIKKEVKCDIRDKESKKEFSQRLTDILDQEKTHLILIGIIGLAFSVNAIELLCSFAIPTAFTATLVSSGISFWKQLIAISIYDLAYMLDDIIVFLVAMWTLNLNIFSARAVQISHFIGGGILLLLGFILTINPGFLSILSS
ncbi:hypothetical protein KAI58_02555 [Candidatus Gracilibacteria bacterium]|nr:hypothetical protein [Candidatus Gracilibacteria bacterium]